MAADGSIIIDTKIDTSNFVNLKQQFSGLASTAKKLGLAIGAAFSVRAITQFAKECLDLGSDLQEVQNVVDVTFTTMNEQVNEFAKNAVTTAGLSETMAKRYAGTFGAMAKAFGFAESEAYTMATALTQLAGDVASFYNITQDEAYTKLKSVFTGETESLKDLGVVMTQAALDSYALANGYGKTTSAMTEQEKVALRYAFVMDQLTAASGDFLRTSDGWANQVRVLSLQFEQLKATIGQGLINAFTPVIKVINTILAGLQKLAAAFVQFTSLLFGNAVSVSAGGSQEELAGIADGYEAAAGGAEDLAESTEKAGKAAQKYLAGFDEIQKLGSESSSGGGSGGDAGGVGVGDFDFGAIGAEMNLEDNIPPQVEAMVAKIRELIAPLQEIDFTPLKTSLAGLGGAFFDLGAIIGDALEWAWFNILVPMAQWTMEEAAPAAIDVLSAALSVLNEILLALQPFATWLWESFLQPIAEWTGGVVVTVLEGLATALTGISDWISENQETVEAMTIVILSFMAAWGIVQLAQVIGGIVTALAAFVTTGGLATAVTTALGTAVAFLTSPITLTVAAIGALIAIIVLLVKNWDAVKETAANVWANIQSIWGGISDWFQQCVLDPIANGFKGMVNGVIGFLNGMIQGIVGGINLVAQALNSLKFSIPSWIPGLGGTTFGFNLPQITAPQIPYLAQGAVIPPNAPFMAVLGDQKHGTNIEAPEDLIRKIVREESGNRDNGRLEELLELLISVVEGIEVGDETIGKAAARYQRKTSRARGG